MIEMDATAAAFTGLHPGPKALAAALLMAGFGTTTTYPTFTDDCGKTWKNPTEQLMALTIIGNESGGNAFATHSNKDGSADYGLMQVNDTAQVKFWTMKSPFTGMKWSWAHYVDNAWAGYQIYRDAIDNLGEPPWKPWVAFDDGYYKRERYEGRSWADWANSGINAMNHDHYKLGIPLTTIASVLDDPLVYWS